MSAARRGGPSGENYHFFCTFCGFWSPLKAAESLAVRWGPLMRGTGAARASRAQAPRRLIRSPALRQGNEIGGVGRPSCRVQSREREMVWDGSDGLASAGYKKNGEQ